VKEALQEVLKTIEDNPHRYQLQLIRWGLPMAIQNLSPKGVLPDTIVKEVLESLGAQTREVLSGLWELVEAPRPPDLEERLRKNGFSHAFGGEPLEGFSLHARIGLVALSAASGLSVVNKKAFLRTSARKPLERTWEGVKTLRPLFAAMGLSDLEGAIEVLLGLEEGEGRVERGYVLVRSGGFWALWRGTFLEDPDLDVAVLAGRDVVLPLPEEGALSFRAQFMCSRVYVDHLGVHREGGGHRIESGGMFLEHLFDGNPVVRALQRELGRQLDLFIRHGRKALFEGLSPNTVDRLRKFVQTEDSSVALRHLFQPAEG